MRELHLFLYKIRQNTGVNSTFKVDSASRLILSRWFLSPWLILPPGFFLPPWLILQGMVGPVFMVVSAFVAGFTPMVEFASMVDPA